MIYLDHNATTPPHEEVILACADAQRRLIGNPSSIHRLGQEARNALERARRSVAALIGASASELTFTSGATEANQIALHLAPGERRAALITSAAEHPSVVGAAAAAVERGVEWHTLPVDAAARLDLADLEARLQALDGHECVVSVMLAQNELGNIYPVARVAELARRYGATTHCDATQAVGRICVDVRALGVDHLTLSGHKFGGPKGIGVLYTRRGGAVAPLFRGGHQERGRRAGTENVSGIVGLGVAAEIAKAKGEALWGHARALAKTLGEALLLSIDDAHWLGDREANIGNTCCMLFEGAPAEELLMALDLSGVAVSAGSACSSGSMEPSPVLLEMGLTGALARCALRFSVGPTNTAEEISRVVEIITQQVAHVRSVHRR